MNKGNWEYFLAQNIMTSILDMLIFEVKANEKFGQRTGLGLLLKDVLASPKYPYIPYPVFS